MPKTFPLTPPSGVLFVSAVALAFVMTGLAVWFAVRLVRQRTTSRVRYSVGRGLVALTLVAGAVYVATVAFEMQAARLRLTPTTLHVDGLALGPTVPVDSLRARGAGTVDLTRQGAFRPQRRLRGLDLPGYQAGWFQLVNRQRVFAYVTDPTRVAYVPTRGGYALLLSVSDPDVLLATLRARAPALPADEDLLTPPDEASPPEASPQ